MNNKKVLIILIGSSLLILLLTYYLLLRISLELPTKSFIKAPNIFNFISKL